MGINKGNVIVQNLLKLLLQSIIDASITDTWIAWRPAKKKIKFRLLTHKDEKDITAEIQAIQRLQKGKSEVSSDVTTRLKYMIQEVDGNGDRGFINKFVVNGLLALDTRSLRSFIKNISPDMDMKFDFTSDITGDTEALDIPFGIGFFYPSEWL